MKRRIVKKELRKKYRQKITQRRRDKTEHSTMREERRYKTLWGRVKITADLNKYVPNMGMGHKKYRDNPELVNHYF